MIPEGRRSSRSLAWGLATAVGLAAGLAGYVAHAGLVSHSPKQIVRVSRLTDMVGLEESPAISSDGKAVAFVAVRGGRRQIWVRRLDGGVPAAITSDDADHYEPRWSADSESLIYYSSGNIWKIPAAGGTARKLADALGPGDLSHHGKSLAFFRLRDSAVELVAGERVVAKLKDGTYSNLRWSSDDDRIAYLDGSTSLMVTRVVSGESVRAATGNARIQGFAWAPDGSGLIVSSGQGSVLTDPPVYNLWFIPRVGDTQSQLTFEESSQESPDASPRGALVVSRIRSQSDIWKFPVTGDPVDNARLRVRITRQTGQVQSVTVNPDDSEVAFLSDSGGHTNVWVARVSDGEMRPLTRESDPRVAVGAPTWSPRGDWIQFFSNGNLWLIKPDGSEALNLGVAGTSACWSGDGLSLSYSEAHGAMRKIAVTGGTPVAVRDDDKVGCEGGDSRKLLDFGARNVVIAGRVAWSTDGKYLYAAVSDIDSDIVMLLGLKWR